MIVDKLRIESFLGTLFSPCASLKCVNLLRVSSVTPIKATFETIENDDLGTKECTVHNLSTTN